MNTSNNTNITPVPFSWGEISLSQTVQINGIPHVTRRAVGEWLEYAEPRKAIDKIIERNQHLENYATTVRLTALDDKNREISVYHPIGFLLLVMESGQPKAQAMKVAVAEFVWHVNALSKRRIGVTGYPQTSKKTGSHNTFLLVSYP